ncbi:MAG TPA: hypothetical protein VF221_07865 [Chloroflexota bacterium]
MIGRIINGRGMQFSEQQLKAFQSLRTTYQTTQHVFTARELDHLRFLRWLVNSPRWNRAMDQPSNTQKRQAPAQEAATWMPGYTG